jgi:hypothetical protein
MKAIPLFVFSVLTVLICLPSRAAAQISSPIPSAGNPMTLDVVAVDKAERPVAGLQANDFKVFDSKTPRSVLDARMISAEEDKTDPPVEAFCWST